MERKFHCENCSHSFWAIVAENVAEEFLTKECPQCGLAVGLYNLIGPITNKRLRDWGFGEFAVVGLALFVGYQGYKALSS